MKGEDKEQQNYRLPIHRNHYMAIKIAELICNYCLAFGKMRLVDVLLLYHAPYTCMGYFNTWKYASISLIHHN